jgi:hypothetical protein
VFKLQYLTHTHTHTHTKKKKEEERKEIEAAYREFTETCVRLEWWLVSEDLLVAELCER